MFHQQGLLALLTIGMLQLCLASPAPFFSPYEARYRITWHGLAVGESQHQLCVENEHYDFSAHTVPNLPFVPYSYSEKARFRYHNQSIYPEHYSFEKQEGSKKKSGALRFDWRQLEIHLLSAPERPPLRLRPGIFDDVSQNFALRKDLRAGKRGDFEYQVVHGEEIRPYHFRWLGEERLETKLGPLETIKLEHASRQGDKRTIFWLSKEHDYLLVYTEQFRKDQLSARAEILSFTPLPCDSRAPA